MSVERHVILALLLQVALHASSLNQANALHPDSGQGAVCVSHDGAVLVEKVSPFGRNVILQPPADNIMVRAASYNKPLHYTVAISSSCALEFSSIRLQLTGACKIEVDLIQPGSKRRLRLTAFQDAFCGVPGFQNLTKPLVGRTPPSLPGVLTNTSTTIRVKISQTQQCGGGTCVVRGTDTDGQGVAMIARDINECTSGLVSCDKPLNCQNTLGGYTCQCPHQHSLHTALMPAESGMNVTARTACVPNSCLEMCSNDNITVCMAAETGDSDCLCSWSISENMLNCSMLPKAIPTSNIPAKLSTIATSDVSTTNVSPGVFSGKSEEGAPQLQALFVLPGLFVILLIVIAIFTAKKCHEGSLTWALVKWRVRYATSALPKTKEQRQRRYIVTRELSRSDSCPSVTVQHSIGDSKQPPAVSNGAVHLRNGHGNTADGNSARRLIMSINGTNARLSFTSSCHSSLALQGLGAPDAEASGRECPAEINASDTTSPGRLCCIEPTPTCDSFCELPSRLPDTGSVVGSVQQTSTEGYTDCAANPADRSSTVEIDIQDETDGNEHVVISRRRQSWSNHSVTSLGEKSAADRSSIHSLLKKPSRAPPTPNISRATSRHSISQADMPASHADCDPRLSHLSEIGLFPELSGMIKDMNEHFNAYAKSCDGENGEPAKAEDV